VFSVDTFRYSGRTQKELVEFVRENYVTPAPFQRCVSFTYIFHCLWNVGEVRVTGLKVVNVKITVSLTV